MHRPNKTAEKFKKRIYKLKRRFISIVLDSYICLIFLSKYSFPFYLHHTENAHLCWPSSWMSKFFLKKNSVKKYQSFWFMLSEIKVKAFHDIPKWRLFSSTFQICYKPVICWKYRSHPVTIIISIIFRLVFNTLIALKTIEHRWENICFFS